MEVSFGDISNIKWIQMEDLPIISCDKLEESNDGKFSMGIISKATNKVARKKKVRKGPVKRSKTIKYDIFNSTNSLLQFNFNFHIYQAPKLFVPSSIQLTHREQHKFDTVNMYNPVKKSFLSTFNNIVLTNTFHFLYNTTYISFLQIPHMLNFMKNSKSREECEWNKIKRLYIKLFKLRSAIKKLSHMWIYKKSLKNVVNVEDVATMEVPNNPVYVVNIARRCSYVYEATTLRRAINNKLLSSEYMFISPQYPLNILSNEQFTYMQNVSIYNQLKGYGGCSWAYERFKVYGFNLRIFELKCNQQLKLSAINNHFYNEPLHLFETVYDYFTLVADDSNIEEFYIRAFKGDFLKNDKPSRYVQAWINLTRRRYISQVTSDPNGAIAIREESEKLLLQIFSIYN